MKKLLEALWSYLEACNSTVSRESNVSADADSLHVEGTSYVLPEQVKKGSV